MPRYKLTIEYDGTGFYGWQRQESLPTIQGMIEQAIYNFCGEKVSIQCAGRTDAGVHARGQVAHLDVVRRYDPHTLLMAVNDHLIRLSQHRPQIAILSVEEVEETFNARFDAKQRHYQYRIINRRSMLALEQNRAWQIPTPLDIEVMQEGADYLIGQHDFTSFRAVACQSNSPVKTIDHIHIERKESVITINVAALSFLHHQVRNIVGTLKLVGDGRIKPHCIQEIIAAKNRKKAGATAPACGLYFMWVQY